MQKIYPFKFLDSYQREDKDFFFGRNEEIDTLYQMIFQTKILLIYGTSGTGKTSLIQCGLANKFQTYDWLSLYIRRGNNLISSLDKTLCNESDDVFTYAEEKEPTIKNLAAKIAAVYKASFKPLYLIFDQFEELYVLGTKEEQQNFIQIVKEILALEQPVKIILSIREEYLGYLYEFERAVPELLRKKLRVEPMNLDKVKNVITNIGLSPQSNVHLKTGEEALIAESIFIKIRGEEKTLSIQLPYLQVFLDSLYMKKTNDATQRTEATITNDDVEKTGNIGDVLRNFLDEQVALTSKNLDQKPETIWKILSPFVTLEGTKEPLSSDQLMERFPDESTATINSILEAFVKSRILRYTEKDQLYEVAHDSLAKQINAKRSDEEIAILEVQRLIKSQVAVKKEAREYFTERQLLFIEPYLEKFKESPEELDWISKSRIYRQEEQKSKQDQELKLQEAKATKKRLRTMYSLLSIVLIALSAAVYFWFQSNQKTRMANEQKNFALIEKSKADSTAAVLEKRLGELKNNQELLKKTVDLAKANGVDKTQIEKIQKESLKIGSYYKGGIVIYLNESGEHGLIVAENDENKGGKTDWQKASDLCTEIPSDDSYKWRLPTIQELSMIYAVKNYISGINTNDLYWSSTPAGTDIYRLIKFDYGTTTYNYNKNRTFLVRAVRNF